MRGLRSLRPTCFLDQNSDMAKLNPTLPLLLATLLIPVSLAGQDSTWQAITPEGVVRASSLVDSVFIDKQINQAVVGGAYLMARLGVNRIPPDFQYRVRVDTALIHLGGRLADLPEEAKSSLGPLVMFLKPETRLLAEIDLQTAGPRAVHFRLRSVLIDGVPVPESLLQPVMASVGDEYPALTSSGRDLYVEIPQGGRMALRPDSVALALP
jgi:hypothetical protein